MITPKEARALTEENTTDPNEKEATDLISKIEVNARKGHSRLYRPYKNFKEAKEIKHVLLMKGWEHVEITAFAVSFFVTEYRLLIQW